MKEATRAVVCGQKIRHNCKGDANRHANELRKSAPLMDAPLRSYRCTFCHKYHVGHVTTAQMWEIEAQERAKREQAKRNGMVRQGVQRGPVFAAMQKTAEENRLRNEEKRQRRRDMEEARREMRQALSVWVGEGGNEGWIW